MGFWSERYWLPREVTWDQVPSQFSDLAVPIFLAFPMFIIRILWESFVGVTIGHYRGYYPKGTTLSGNIWNHLTGGFAQNSRPKRILECFSRFCYYTAAFIYGFHVLRDQIWLYDVKQCWVNYPYHPISDSVWWYYMVETGFYYSLLLATFFDTRRSDFWELILHHIITVLLLSASWAINFVRVGTLVLISHDVSDILLEGGKLVRYDKHNKTLTNIMFVLFFASWILTRLVYYPLVVIRSAVFEAADLIQDDYDLTDFTMVPYAPRLIVMMLVMLLFLHVFWTFIIMRIVIRTVTGRDAKDVRSDSDSDYDEAEQARRASRRKLLRKKKANDDVDDSEGDNDDVALSESRQNGQARKRTGARRHTGGMAECVRVITRCRPFNDREKALSSKLCVEMTPSSGQVSLQGPDGINKDFTFDGAYFMDSTGEQIYNDIVFPLVENVIEGYNGTVFAYGQTGAGKTFSMQGVADIVSQRGVIPRAFDHIFTATATTENVKFLVHCSYLEIYNEEVRDLLGADNKQKLEIKEHADRGVYVAGLSMHVCHDVQACKELMDRGFNNRHVGATLMNKDSSRSHSIFTVYVEGITESGSIRMGKLNLVDLAGSERQSKTGATGDRFKEATKINLSLSALGNVISALVDGKSKHIPYRDSKLTRLLQDSLGGNTKTIMIACISPSDNNYDETLSTLRYANRAKNIRNKPKINEDPKDALLREYQEEIERLKAMVQPRAAVQTNVDLEEERAKLRAEFEEAMNELRCDYEKEQTSKAELQRDLVALKAEYERASANLENMGNLDPEEAARKLQQLQEQFIGGEQANNVQLKQKRMKQLHEAETKTQKLAAALNVHKDDPLLQVYSSTQEKLDAVSAQLEKEQRRVKAMEREIEDLQSEFELDRLDYLDTIRKQDQQLKLYMQIMAKVQPILKKDTNYSNLERIKKDAVWNEDESRWILPEMSVSRTVLPSATNGAMSSPNKTESTLLRTAYDDEGSKLRRRLARSEEENLANNYFKPVKQFNVLSKYQGDQQRNLDVKSYFPMKSSTFDGLINGVVYTDDVFGRTQSAKRPARLESLHK
ncbi:unnamed protein product [Caenorhabditis auriculariae]|uniref:Kinesin motor domain-containing protein n=1 Tax=Caenorhabditis auriculariae TaxID=2777116 RepID=A0A8S1H734_9PELO|nr:unnamed protein product [Caenorhabditis auriculariae]